MLQDQAELARVPLHSLSERQLLNREESRTKIMLVVSKSVEAALCA